MKSKHSITIDEEVFEKISQMAEDDDRNFSQYVNLVLSKWIKENSTSSRSSSKKNHK